LKPGPLGRGHGHDTGLSSGVLMSKSLDITGITDHLKVGNKRKADNEENSGLHQEKRQR